MSRFLFQ
jgi:hypothetical protein